MFRKRCGYCEHVYENVFHKKNVAIRLLEGHVVAELVDALHYNYGFDSRWGH